MLNANYLKARLERHYPVFYAGANGRVAHELIFDLRSFKASAGIDEQDVAKRLMDYGFHAPTVSFPVPGTLMVEPTESEPKEELDRFVEAKLAIFEEILAVADGRLDPRDNPLKNAPHTAEDVSASDWPHADLASKPPIRWRPCVNTSSGHQSPESTIPSVTGTSSARAHRWKRTRNQPSADTWFPCAFDCGRSSRSACSSGRLPPRHRPRAKPQRPLAWTVGPYTGGSFVSPVGTHWGITPDRRHLFIGLHATIPIIDRPRWSFRYAPELVPLLVVTNNPTDDRTLDGDGVPITGQGRVQAGRRVWVLTDWVGRDRPG